jgi:hypothetical protein
LHDIADLDARGVPGGFVASSQFVEASQTQASSLGFEPGVVFVPHPIQDRTDEEIVELADKAFPEILELVLRSANKQEPGIG